MRPMARWHLIFLRFLPFQRRRVTRDGLSTLCDIPATGTTPRPTAAGATGVSGPRHNHFCANAGGGEGSTEPLLQPIETAAAAEVGFKSYSSREICAPGLVNFPPTVAFYFCLNLPAAFTQPGTSALADLSIPNFRSRLHAE